MQKPKEKEAANLRGPEERVKAAEFETWGIWSPTLSLSPFLSKVGMLNTFRRPWRILGS